MKQFGPLLSGLFMMMLCTAEAKSAKEILRTISRVPRHLIGLLTSSANLEELEYPFCRFNNQTAACLEDVVCAGERGVFLGYCGYADGVCCNVVKTCNGKSASHAVRFQNPKFPQNETTSRLCPLTLHIGRGICAVRMIFDYMQLSKYQDDHCPVESLTILGTNRKTAPLCGNMTGWETTFEVNEFSTITFAYTLQGNPNYKFSMQLLQLPCKNIVDLKSPINAGIRNLDAKKYIPAPSLNATSTTKKPEEETTTSEPSTEETTVVTEGEVDVTTPTPEEGEDDRAPTTTFVPPVRSEENNGSTEGTTTSAPTRSTLPLGVIPTTATSKPLVIAKRRSDIEDEIVGSYDPTPVSTIFRRIFESRLNDKCFTYEDPELADYLQSSSQTDDAVEARQEADDPSYAGDKCWVYDVEAQMYKVSDECEVDYDSVDEEPASFRVVGGRLTNLNEYPWQVALLNKKRFFCGGALISDRHILTASHCLYGSFASGIQDLKVTLGDHDLRTKNETDNALIGVRRVIWNLNYDGDTTENDIGIVELEEPVEFSYSISPANLPTDLNHTYEGENVTVTGWGRDSLRNKKTSPILKEYTSVVDNINTCVARWKPYPKVSAIKGMHICLNVTYGTPCHGDSGGPLVACSGSRCTLVGVVSFGFPLCRNVGLPAVFTRVSSYKRWIDINTTPIFAHELT